MPEITTRPADWLTDAYPGAFFFISASSSHHHGVPVPKIDGRPVPKNSRGPQHTRSSMSACRHAASGASEAARPFPLFPVVPCGGSSDSQARAQHPRRSILRKANSGIRECQCPRDGDGDARTILRALAGPGHRLHLPLKVTATRPGRQQQNIRHPSIRGRRCNHSPPDGII